MYASRRMQAASQRMLARVMFAPAGARSIIGSMRAATAATPASSASTLQISLQSPLFASSSPLGSTLLSGGGAGSVRALSTAAGAGSDGVAAAPSGEDGEEGRESAPVAAGEAEQQGQGKTDGTSDSSKPQMTQAEKDKAEGRVTAEELKILDVDPYPPEKLAALEKKYDWVDWNSMAHHLHMSDVHFFDQEVPYVDQDFTIRPDFRLLHRLEGANRLKRLQEHEDKKILRLLDFGYWVTSGRNTRVATEGKISSVWSMVVGGDQNGTASFGFGKGEDMGIADRRAMQDLRRNMLFVPLFESRTISHEIEGKHGVCKVRMWPRPREAGMTAGMIPRMIFECFGLQDITAKVDGRALPHHQALAIFNGLREVKNLREEAIRRGVTAHRMYERGLAVPRHPGRQELFRRGKEVSSLLREIRAQQIQDEMMLELDPKDPKAQANVDKWAEPDFESSPVEDPNPDANYVPPYIIRRPRPVDLGAHHPAPKYPQSKRAPIKETLNKRRGLPHPKTPQTKEHTRLA